jgi:hypothetical protein
MPAPKPEQPLLTADVPVAGALPRAESKRASQLERLAFRGLALIAGEYAVGLDTCVLCVASYILTQISVAVFVSDRFVTPHHFLSTEAGFMSAAAAWIGLALFARTLAEVTVAQSGGVIAPVSQSAAVS